MDKKSINYLTLYSSCKLQAKRNIYILNISKPWSFMDFKMPTLSKGKCLKNFTLRMIKNLWKLLDLQIFLHKISVKFSKMKF